jgi:hypothetical protein
MKSIDRRIRRLEQRFDPPENEAARKSVALLLDRRRRRLEASGQPFEDWQSARLTDDRGRPLSVSEILIAGRIRARAKPMNALTWRVRRLENQFAPAHGKRFLLVVFHAGWGRALDQDTCIEILGECGFLPTGTLGLVNFGKIPKGLNAKETERFLREQGAEICGSRATQNLGRPVGVDATTGDANGTNLRNGQDQVRNSPSATTGGISITVLLAGLDQTGAAVVE